MAHVIGKYNVNDISIILIIGFSFGFIIRTERDDLSFLEETSMYFCIRLSLYDGKEEIKFFISEIDKEIPLRFPE